MSGSVKGCTEEEEEELRILVVGLHSFFLFVYWPFFLLEQKVGDIYSDGTLLIIRSK